MCAFQVCAVVAIVLVSCLFLFFLFFFCLFVCLFVSINSKKSSFHFNVGEGRMKLYHLLVRKLKFSYFGIVYKFEVSQESLAVIFFLIGIHSAQG